LFGYTVNLLVTERGEDEVEGKAKGELPVNREAE
jgi:hypothetical protein